MQAQLRSMRAPATHMPVRVSSSRPVGAVALPVVRPAAPMGLRRTLPIVCSSGVAHPGEEASGRGFADGDASFFVNASVPHVTMARGGGQNYGSGGSLGAVMERSKLQFVMPTPPQQGPKLDDSGSGGDNGKNLHNGGGGGGGDDDDDDDYFGEDDGEGGDGNGGEPWRGPNWFRTAVPELFDRLSIAAVLQEWHKTIIDLPLFIRRAVEMGLFSSAQLVRFLSVDVRPNITRTVSRSLPTEWAREFVGRLMADPGFCQKLMLEQCMAAGFSLFHEWRTRGDKFKDELDLVAINTMGMMAATAACVWVTAPSRSYGAVHKFPWQQMLAQLPSSVFDASGPLRQYSAGTRVAGLFSTGVQLSAVGALAGAATAAASQAAVALRQRSQPEWAPSVPVPDVARSSGGLAAFFAVNANLRYQLMGGVDRYLFSHASALWGYMLLTGAARVGSQYVGELSRPAWQGLATETAPRTRVRRVRRRKAAAVADKPAAAPAPEASTSGLVAATAAAAAVAGEQAASTSGAAPAVKVATSTSGVDAASAEAVAVPAGEAEAQAAASSGVAEAEDALLSSGGAVMASPDQLQQLLTEQQEQRAAAERQLSGVVGAAATSALTQAATQAVA